MSAGKDLISERCWVIGNGPSLRGFDLRRLDGDATLGMNAAYRYWKEIDWYPTYYACLDDEVMATHWREIIALVRDGKVKKAFVSGSLADYDSTILSDDRFVMLDQFIIHWHLHRGKARGQQFFESPYFVSSQETKLTTGSHSVRFASFLGYKEICLLGIDLKYVETIPEAEQTGEIALRIRETPKQNPNYFFDSYQQAGDRYNIPNPKEHHGDLHFASLCAVKEDFFRLRNAPRIINCNARSRLYEERVFPYLHVDKMLNDRPLSSVVVPTTLKEREALLNQLWLFEQANFAPGPTGEFLKPDLTYVFNSGKSGSLEDDIRKHYEGSSRLQEAFNDPTFLNLGLAGEQDQYIRDYSKPAGKWGYKAGPNNQFFETVGHFAPSSHYIFLMESDCLPIKAGWLAKLQTLLCHAEPFWILGSGYRGRTTLGESYKRHINGNAIYAAGDVDFQGFVENFWRPELERIVQANPRIAYDCALEMLMGEARSEEPDDATWKVTQELLHLVRYTDVIQNRSGDRDFWDTPNDLPLRLARQSTETYLLHGKPFAEAVTAMKKSGVEPSVDAMRIPKLSSLAAGGGPKLGGPYMSSKPERSAEADEASEHFPRLLLLDHTRIGDTTATGELKASLFANWPKERLLQVHGGSDKTLALWYDGASVNIDSDIPVQRAALKGRVSTFYPELVIYRPVPDTKALHDFAMEVIHERDMPLITWIMDDWPKALERRDPAQFARLDLDWRVLLRQSAGALGIGDAMARGFRARYGMAFQPFANGIDPAHWQLDGKSAPKTSGTIVVRYSGSLAENMGLASLVTVARAVEALAAEGVSIKFEIKARRHWVDSAGKAFAGLQHTSLMTTELSAEDYRAWMSAADIVLIAYNFDEASKDYIRYSVANKLPECLACGAALMAIGPADIASMELLKSLNCSVNVTTGDADTVLASLRDLATSPDKRKALVEKAKRVARQQFNIVTKRKDFANWILDVAGTSQTDLSIKIARNSERRRWGLNHPKVLEELPAEPAPAPILAPLAPYAPALLPAGVVANGRDSYIKPVQVISPTGPAGSPSIGAATSSTSSTAPATDSMGGLMPHHNKPLTVFQIRSGNGAAAPSAPAHGQSPISQIAIEAAQPVSAIQATAAPVSTPSQERTPQPRQATPPQATGGAVRWIVSQLKRRRAAQAAAAGMVLLVVATVALLMIVPQGDLRTLIIAVGGMSVLAVAGLYFAYRTLLLARRLSLENASFQQRLLETTQQLTALQRDYRNGSAQQTNNVNAIATRIERAVASGAENVESRLSQLSVSVRADIAQLKDAHSGVVTRIDGMSRQATEQSGAIEALRREQASSVQALGAATGKLAEVNARADGLQGDLSRVKDVQAGAGAHIAALSASVGDSSARTERSIEALLARSVALSDSLAEVREQQSGFARELGEGALALLNADIGQLRETDARTSREVEALLERAAAMGDALAEVREQQAATARELGEGAQALQAATSYSAALSADVVQLRESVSTSERNIEAQLELSRSHASNLDAEIGKLRGEGAKTSSDVDALLQRAAATGDSLAEIREQQAGFARQLSEGALALQGASAHAAGLSVEIGQLRQADARIGAEVGALIERSSALGDTILEVREQQISIGNNLAGRVDGVEQHLAGAAAELRGSVDGVAASVAAVQSFVAAEASHGERLAARLAHVDDIAKAALAAATDEAIERKGKLTKAQADLTVRVDQVAAALKASESAGAKSLAIAAETLASQVKTIDDVLSHTVRAQDTLVASVEGLKQATGADRQDLAFVGQRLAELAGLAEEVALESSQALAHGEARLQALEEAAKTSDAGIASDVAGLVAQLRDLDKKITASDTGLTSDIAAVRKHVQMLDASVGAKAEAKVLQDLTGQVAALTKRAEEAALAAGKELGEITKRIAAAEQTDKSAAADFAALSTKVADTTNSFAAIDVRHGETRQAIDGLRASAGQAQKDLGELQAGLSGAAKSLETAKAEARDGLAKLTTKLDESLSQAEAKTGAVASAQADLAATISGLQANAGKLSERAAELADAIAQIGAKGAEGLAGVTAGLTSADEKIAVARQAQVQAAQRLQALEQSGKADSLKAAEVSTNVAALTGKLDSTAQAQAQALAKLQALEQSGKVETLKATEVSAKVGALEGKLETAVQAQVQVAAKLQALEQSGKAEALKTTEVSTKVGALTGKLDATAQAQAQAAAKLQALEQAGKVETLKVTEASTKVGALEGKLDATAQAQAQAAAKLQALEQAGKVETLKVTEVSAKVGALEGRLETAAQGLAQAAAKLQALEVAAKAETQKLADHTAKAGAAESKVGVVAQAQQQALARLDSLEARSDSESLKLKSILNDIAGAGQKLSSTGLEGIATRVSEAVQRVEAVEKTAMFDNASWYQRFNRKLRQEHIQTLEKEWLRKLSVSMQRSAFGYMATRANEIERELDGRLATSIEDIMLRSLVAQATKGQSIDVLEIGTLFGVGAAIMFDSLKNRYKNICFTLLDPLEGYYSDGRPDILTGQPVTEQVLRRNMARAGMTDDQVRTIRLLSTDPQAILQASERQYDLLVIDADHSYAGVKADFENYARMVRLGGHIIFDDYSSEDWPDVKAYVDAEMPAADFLAHVGNSWRTSVYRVVKAPPPPRAPSRPRGGAAAAPKSGAKGGTRRR